MNEIGGSRDAIVNGIIHFVIKIRTRPLLRRIITLGENLFAEHFLRTGSVSPFACEWSFQASFIDVYASLDHLH